MTRYILILIYLLMNGVSLAQPSSFQSKTDFLKKNEYLLKAGGIWEAENPKYNASEEWSPSSFGYKFEAGYAENSIRIKINGKVKDKRYLYWDGYYFWDALKNKICYRSMGTSGQIASGESINNDGDLLFEVLLPDGKITYHLDTDEIVSDNEFKSQSYEFVESEWKPLNTLVWKRINETKSK